jgi:hypothetical protein
LERGFSKINLKYFNIYIFILYLCLNNKDKKMAKAPRTSKRVGKVASKALRSKKTSKTTKTLAGSSLRQRRKK